MPSRRFDLGACGVMKPRGSQDSKGGAVETGCSGLHYIKAVLLCNTPHPLHPPATAPPLMNTQGGRRGAGRSKRSARHSCGAGGRQEPPRKQDSGRHVRVLVRAEGFEVLSSFLRPKADSHRCHRQPSAMSFLKATFPRPPCLRMWGLMIIVH